MSATDRTTVPDLVQLWVQARLRAFTARHIHKRDADPLDYWAELRLGTEISREVLSGRWCAVAELLRVGGVESWSQVGNALGMDAVEARSGFFAWISGQQGLHRRDGLGLTDDDAEALFVLAEAVAR